MAFLLGQVGFVGSNGEPAGEGGTAFETFDAAKAYVSNPSNQPPGRRIEQAATQAGGQIVDWSTAVGNFFGQLTQRQTLVRIAEGIIGIALLVIGLAKLAGAEQYVPGVGQATTAAKALKK